MLSQRKNERQVKDSAMRCTAAAANPNLVKKKIEFEQQRSSGGALCMNRAESTLGSAVMPGSQSLAPFFLPTLILFSIAS